MSSLPISAPESHLALLGIEPDSVPVDPVADGLLDALAAVPDPRKRRGVRYAFTAVLACAVCAVLAGARHRDDPQDRALHLMGCLEHDSGVVLAQTAVDGKTNEIPMFSVVLDQIEDLSDVLITADALHAQREHATYLHARGAHYLICVKGNQPKLRNQLRALPWADVPVGHTRTDRAHGRIEKRSIKVVTITAGILFPHAAQAIQVIRRTRRTGTMKK